MTGQQFQEHIEDSQYSQRQLAEHWGISHTTIQRECRRDEVRGLYADAIHWETRDSECRPEQMKWTGEPPTDPGWYWIDDGGGAGLSPRIVEVEATRDGVQVSDPHDSPSIRRPVFDYDRWAGPIPEPSE